jgi:hypothetical protein
MVANWVCSSNNIESLRTLAEKLVWGFWWKDFQPKGNWRQFIGEYEKISDGDAVIFQLRDTGHIHSLGVVKEKFYDDQTKTFPYELERNRVLFYNRLKFHIVIFSEKSEESRERTPTK